VGQICDFDKKERTMQYIPIIVIVILLVSWAWTGVRIVQPDQVGVVLTFGKYSYTAGPGLNFITR